MQIIGRNFIIGNVDVVVISNIKILNLLVKNVVEIGKRLMEND